MPLNAHRLSKQSPCPFFASPSLAPLWLDVVYKRLWVATAGRKLSSPTSSWVHFLFVLYCECLGPSLAELLQYGLVQVLRVIFLTLFPKDLSCSTHPSVIHLVHGTDSGSQGIAFKQRLRRIGDAFCSCPGRSSGPFHVPFPVCSVTEGKRLGSRRC